MLGFIRLRHGALALGVLLLAGCFGPSALKTFDPAAVARVDSRRAPDARVVLSTKKAYKACKRLAEAEYLRKSKTVKPSARGAVEESPVWHDAEVTQYVFVPRGIEKSMDYIVVSIGPLTESTSAIWVNAENASEVDGARWKSFLLRGLAIYAVDGGARSRTGKAVESDDKPAAKPAAPAKPKKKTDEDLLEELLEAE